MDGVDTRGDGETSRTDDKKKQKVNAEDPRDRVKKNLELGTDAGLKMAARDIVKHNLIEEFSMTDVVKAMLDKRLFKDALRSIRDLQLSEQFPVEGVIQKMINGHDNILALRSIIKYGLQSVFDMPTIAANVIKRKDVVNLAIFISETKCFDICDIGQVTDGLLNQNKFQVAARLCNVANCQEGLIQKLIGRSLHRVASIYVGQFNISSRFPMYASNAPLRWKGGEILFVNDDLSLQLAERKLNQWRSLRRDSPLLGLDTESKPNRSKEDNHPVSLLQVSTDSTSYIFDLLTISKEADTLIGSLMKDKGIIKVGMGFKMDTKELRRSYPECKAFDEVYSYLELPALFNARYPQCSMTPGLNKLALYTFNCNLDKSLQQSNWAKRPLDPDQLVYAAIDAYCQLEIVDLFTEELCPQQGKTFPNRQTMIQTLSTDLLISHPKTGRKQK